jgi:hypothetical protein
MSPRTARIVATVVLGYSLAFLPALCAADDTPSPAKTRTPAPKATDWSHYAYVADVVGEIVKADNNKLTLRVTWFTTQTQGNGRPNLSGNHRNFHNPYAAAMHRPRVTVKQQHHDYELEFVPESLVRTKTLPPKLDENGKKVNYKQKELDEMRSPPGAPGYAGSVLDLAPGTIVEVIIIRDKTIPPAKATENDLRVKYAIVLGKDPNPPKDISNQKPDPKKNAKAKN